MKCYISRKLLYIIPLIAILFTWNCNGDEVRYRGALVGMWMTSRLPAVNGVDAESYLTRMNISPKDTSTFMGYRFMPDGTVLYYPFIQHDGTYIPGNCIEGTWLIKGRTLYMARKTYQLRPFYEIELIDSVLRFHQTKQMQLAYAQSLIDECNSRLLHQYKQSDILEITTLLAHTIEVKRSIEQLPSSYTVYRDYFISPITPHAINNEHESALAISTDYISGDSF